MSSSLNKVMLIGYLGSDVELRKTQDGQSVANLSLATSRSWVDNAGQKQEKTEWHRVTVWGKQADACAKFVGKGSLVFIEGSIAYHQYKDKDGVQKNSTDITAVVVQFLGKKEQSQGQNQQQSNASQPPFQGQPAGDFSNNDIPF